MPETRVSERAESVGASPAVEDPTVATPQDPTATVVPDDARDVLLSAARTAIAQTLGTTTSHAATAAHAGTPPAWALEPGASFVTLTKNGRLRGCIGSFAAQRPLLEDVRANAVAAATRDPRFAPMTPDELPAVAIEVSVLSAPRPLRVSSLGEAYAALRPGVDGVIVETGACHRATLLPQMWQHLPDPAQFLGHLWLKAGLAPGLWHEGTTLQTYTVCAWHEEPEAPRGVRDMQDDKLAASPGVATWPDAPTARWWSALDDGRLQCDLCPRRCRLHPGQRGFCFVRARDGDRMVLTTYGRSSGFAIDPVEKKPLSHFHPGTAVLSFGTAGCNLNCGFCQNWDISKSREWDRLAAVATPDGIARTAESAGCDSVAFTYNDPVIFAEYAIDTAVACHERGLHALAVTAGYITARARAEFFAPMDAANIDLKGFTEAFYWKVTGSHLRDVLDTIVWVHEHTDTWLELTTLLIPGYNDARDEVERMCRWILAELGPDVPLHFSAFHPDFKMLDVPPTPPATLRTARATAIDVGLHFVYTGNVHDPAGETTSCPTCGHVLVERDWYAVLTYLVTADGRCPECGTVVPGRFGTAVGHWGRRSLPVRIA